MEMLTARLRLREFKINDWKAVHRYSSDEEVVRYLTWGPNTKTDTKAFVERVIDLNRKKPRKHYDFLLEHRETGEVIGACGIYLTPVPEEAEMGWVLRRDCWNQGYITETAIELLGFGFAILGLHRVFAACIKENAASARVMEKAGMRREGCLKKSRRLRAGSDGWCDEFLFAVLDEEWDKNRFPKNIRFP